MITLVTGGSGSGKSAYAESLLSSCEGIRYYIATMQIYDAEGEKKVERHRKLRAGKGFLTIESPMNVGKIRFACAGEAEQAQYRQEAERKVQGNAEKKSALLECMSNLTANEMFSGEQPVDRQPVITKILQGMEGLRKQADPLVIVTNNVFEDGMIYDDSTMEYIEALGRMNERLAAEADEVVEVIAGIPQRIKPGSPGAKAQNRQDSRG